MRHLCRFALALALNASCYPQDNVTQNSGCGKDNSWNGTTQSFQIASSGGNRGYRLHLPQGYSPDKPTPLIVAYHGSGGNPTEFEKTTRFSEHNVNPDMIVAYPLGINGNWQGPTYATPGVNDEIFTTDLIGHLTSQFCIDSRRIYATGHSNGGGFVGTLACSPDHGGQFAAFAPVSGAFYTDVRGNENCTPSRSLLPILEVHGGNDTTIPYIPDHDGRGGPLPSIPDWLARWSVRDVCSSSTTTTVSQDVQHVSWTCHGKEGVLQHYKVDGHGHGWLEATSRLDASRVVVEFLREHYSP